jgi:Electron transfer DM13
MNHYSLIFILCVTMVACTKNDSTPTTASALGNVDSALIGSNSTVISSGNFVNAVHTTSGKASWHVVGTKQTIYLTNFSTDAGPNLKVYLSKDLKASSFITLGDLKANTGNQIYPITTSATPSEYKYVLIWCERFSVLFGSARIQ